MPTYDYACVHCGNKFELSQNMTAQPLKKCPKCNKKVKRLIGSGSGIIFKGHGFYATDYRKKPKTEPKTEPKAGKDNPCPKNCDACKHK